MLRLCVWCAGRETQGGLLASGGSYTAEDCNLFGSMPAQVPAGHVALGGVCPVYFDVQWQQQVEPPCVWVCMRRARIAGARVLH